MSWCVNLPLLVHCLVLVPNIQCVLCLALFLWCPSLCPFYLGNHLAEDERARDFTLVVFLQSCGYLCSVSLPRGAVRWFLTSDVSLLVV